MIVTLPIHNCILTARKPFTDIPFALCATLGEYIKRRRSELKLPQTAVAKILGATHESISNWEQKKSYPQRRYIPGIMKFLGNAGYNPPEKELGAKIWAYRKTNRLSRIRFVKLSGVNSRTLYILEKKGGLVTAETKRKIEVFLSTTPPIHSQHSPDTP